MDTYNPVAISADDTRAVLARIDRYCQRHGSEYGETPVPGGDWQEAAAVIVADWQIADWTALEWTYIQRNGRPLFGPDLSDMGRHMRAVLFMAGRARRRGWVEAGPMRRAADMDGRRRDMDDSRGAGMASRAADPARLVEAVEAVQRSGVSVTPVDWQGRRLRWVKTRNTHGYCVEVIRREADRTVIQFAPWTRYNFRQAGDTPARALPKTLKRVPAGVTRADMMEALTGR